MKIALIGYGKMGQIIEKIAQNRGHYIGAKIKNCQIGDFASIQSIEEADICIDFSHPSCAVENIQKLAQLGKNIVMGTTGWYEQIDEVRAIVKESGIGFLYAPNFSLGVHLFLQMVEAAAVLMQRFDIYDVSIMESHHSQKADAPSGTAKAIATTLLDHIKRKDILITEAISRPLAVNELQISSMRCGSIPGTHSIFFDSPADTITLTHQARNREGFAIGAVIAAEWLVKRAGFYSFEEMLYESSML